MGHELREPGFWLGLKSAHKQLVSQFDATVVA